MIYLLSPLKKEGTIHLPMIDFTLLQADMDFSAIDLLMFTSKQAVKSAEAINPKWKQIPCLAIGSATAKQIEALGGEVCYQPETFYGKSLAQDIVDRFFDKKILYLRPKKVSFDSKAFLARSGIKIKEQIIYKTSCIHYDETQKPLKDAKIIFTSPSTIECFLQNFAWDESYTAIVIGEATKEHLPKNARYVVADTPTIDASIQKAKELLTANRL